MESCVGNCGGFTNFASGIDYIRGIDREIYRKHRRENGQ
jgi:hypothetical protein